MRYYRASYNDTNVSSHEVEKATPQSFALVGGRSAVDFFSINRSSIKSESQKLIFFRFSEFSIIFHRSGNDQKIEFFLGIFFVNYAKIDVYFYPTT